jgi:hypothetical protein
MSLPKIGEKIETWFSGSPDGKSTVMEVFPYTGKYKNFFTHVVKATAFNTTRGWMEFCVNENS